MREFAKISTSIWGSRKFKSLPSDDARLVYLYLHTCPHVNSLGCFVLPFGYALSDLGWNDMDTDPIRYRNCIRDLCDSGLIGFDKGENLVRIVDFLKHSPFSNEKHAKGAIKLLGGIPDCQEKLLLINDISQMKFVSSALLPASSDTEAIPYRYTETETETETRDQERPNGLLSSGDDCRPADHRAEETQAEIEAKSRAAAEAEEVALAVAAYNDTAQQAGWPAVQKLTPARRAALRSRLKEAGGLEGWQFALGKARASPHLCGQNDRGWRASFDFLTAQSSFAKLMEGNYDPRPANPGCRPSGGPYPGRNGQPGGLVGAAMRSRSS